MEIPPNLRFVAPNSKKKSPPRWGYESTRNGCLSFVHSQPTTTHKKLFFCTKIPIPHISSPRLEKPKECDAPYFHAIPQPFPLPSRDPT
jgi:hypothetical protein